MRLTIDQQSVEISDGATILEAAKSVGVEIPTLCHRPEVAPRTSCFLCAVRVEGHESLQPACAMKATEGMGVTTDSEEVQAARRTALELLFSDHAGRCSAPCAMACPARLDIPGFLKPLAQGDQAGALAALRRNLPLAAILGRTCPAPCQNTCFRKKIEEPLSIRLLHRFLADADLASRDPHLPTTLLSSGKEVAFLGTGAVALSTAWFLLQMGHGCTFFDPDKKPGGALRLLPEDQVEKGILDAEIKLIERLGAVIECGRDLSSSIEEQCRYFDVMLIAPSGPNDEAVRAAAESLPPESRPKNLFFASDVIRDERNVTRAVGAGRSLALLIARQMRGETISGSEKPFYFVNRDENESEAELLFKNKEKITRGVLEPLDITAESAEASKEVAQAEADRCLQCGCSAEETCKLREYGGRYGAKAHRFRGERRHLEPDLAHGEIAYEPGKCILCGLCLKIAQEAGEERGLSFVGRGFPTRVAVPLGADLPEGLQKSARKCAENCPTAALTLKE